MNRVWRVGDTTTTYGSIPTGKVPKGARWLCFASVREPGLHAKPLYRRHWRLAGATKANDPPKPNPYALGKPVQRGALAAEQPTLL